MPFAHQYIRVSSDRQAEQGISLDAQRANTLAAAQRLAAERGFTVGDCFADPGVSASKIPLGERPGGLLLEAKCRAGDYVVVHRLDRAFRDPGDQFMSTARFAARGVMFFEADGFRLLDITDPTIEAMAGMMAVFNRHQNRMNTVRVMEAKGAALDRGEFPFNNVPYGWKLNVEYRGKRRKRFLVPNAEEIELLHTLTALADSHGTTQGSKVCKAMGLRFRGKLIVNVHDLDDIVRKWRKRCNEMQPPTIQRMLAALQARSSEGVLA